MSRICGNANKNGLDSGSKSKINITKKSTVKSWRVNGKNFLGKIINSKRLSRIMKFWESSSLTSVILKTYLKPLQPWLHQTWKKNHGDKFLNTSLMNWVFKMKKIFLSATKMTQSTLSNGSLGTKSLFTRKRLVLSCKNHKSKSNFKPISGSSGPLFQQSNSTQSTEKDKSFWYRETKPFKGTSRKRSQFFTPWSEINTLMPLRMMHNFWSNTMNTWRKF